MSHPRFFCLIILLCQAGSMAIGTAYATEAFTPAIIVASDESIDYQDGQMKLVDAPKPGNIALLAWSNNKLSIRSLAGVPVTVIGPPTSIALHPLKPLALVTSAMSAARVGGIEKHIPDTRVTLVRTDGVGETVVASLHIGIQPSGISFLPDGRHALAANRGDGTISVLAVTETAVVEQARVVVAKEADSLVHVEVSPDGKWAVGTLNAIDTILLLKLEADAVPVVAQRLSAGRGPYGARFFPDGSGAVVAHIGSNEIVCFALTDDALRETGRIPVGRIPEGLDISQDGDWLSVSCFEGFGLEDQTQAAYGQSARVYLARREGKVFVKTDCIDVAGCPQFAIFTPDGGNLIVAETSRARLRVLRRRDGRLVSTDQTLGIKGEPVAAQRSPGFIQ